jgi:enediyne biosynthesis protein E4
VEERNQKIKMTKHLPFIAHTAMIFFQIIGASTVQAQAFKEISKEAGINHQFLVYEGMFGGGACVLDFNNDGFEDLFITSGMNEDALYQNNGNGTFTNVYEKSGLTISRKFVSQGTTSADVNRDGWVDIFVTTITTKDSAQQIPRAENLLFLNNGNSTFRDATEEYKLKDLQSFSTGASFGDINADGFPDLYVGNYFQDYEGTLTAINDATIVNANATSKGYLLKNMDGKYFSNDYSDYGMSHKGFGFGGVFTDFDNDRDVDLFIHHDFGYKATPDILFENQYPKMFFKDITIDYGMDLKINSMGTAVGDYNNDGLLDYYITNIRFNRFMVSHGIGQKFTDEAAALGMGFVSISWGTNFADFDHDTDLDLFVANGDLNPNDVPMADYYFENTNGKFQDIAYKKGLNDYGVGRGSVTFDMDNDGDLDLLVVNQKPVLNSPVTSETKLYRNDSTKGNWLKVSLQGTQAEKHGIGSRVEVVIGKLKLLREIDGGSSHISQNSTIAHFGLGKASVVDSVIVIWTGGKKQVLTNQKINKHLIIIETVDAEKGTSLSYWFWGGSVLAILVLISISFIKYSKWRSRGVKVR